jgi:S-methylmethionine-dependent homocysteine/selenocysteine methylase
MLRPMAEQPFAALASRLASGRPLLLGADIAASLRGRGVTLQGPGALGKLLRERPYEVERYYHAEIEAGADVLPALTSETTPRVLAQVGMGFRSAALTSSMVDRALQAAEAVARPVVVAGVLGGESVAPLDIPTLVEEHGTHAARLAAAGAGLILARGIASRTELMAAVVAAANTGLPTWAVVEADEEGTVLENEDPGKIAPLLEAAGASALLFEVPSAEIGARLVARLGEWPIPVGLLVDASVGDAAQQHQRWIDNLGARFPPQARILGGGHGCTEAHTQALARWMAQTPQRQYPSHRPTTTIPRG